MVVNMYSVKGICHIVAGVLNHLHPIIVVRFLSPFKGNTSLVNLMKFSVDVYKLNVFINVFFHFNTNGDFSSVVWSLFPKITQFYLYLFAGELPLNPGVE